MKKYVYKPIALPIMLIALLIFSLSARAQSRYIHDPMENPKAAADIIVDPNAVYGYAPNPASTRMGAFAEYDWSDEAFVAEMRSQREEYHRSVSELYQLKADMEAEGRTVEEIARAISTRRNEIRIQSYKDNPDGLEHLKQSNLAKYGNETGGTPEYYYAECGSWEAVIEKAFSTNPGADAILGLYDIYYDTYIINSPTDSTEGQAPSTESADTETTAVTEPPEHTASEPTERAVPASADSLPATADRSLISPQTGDISMTFVLIMSLAGFAAFMSAAELRAQKKKDR